MSNSLVKSTRTQFKPGSPYIPATPGQPYAPAYTSTETVTQCSYVYSSAAGSGDLQWIWVEAEDGSLYYVPAPNTSGGQSTVGLSPTPSYQCYQVQVQVNHPEQLYIAPTAAQNAVPSQTIIDYNIGWNSGGESVITVHGNSAVKFKAPKNVAGVYAGMRIVRSYDPGLIPDVGFYLTRGFYRIRFFDNPAANLIGGGYVEGAEFTVHRADGVYTLKVDGVVAYTNTYSTNNDVKLAVSLYSGEDTVYDPSVVLGGSAAVAIKAMDAAAHGYQLNVPNVGNAYIPYMRTRAGTALKYGVKAETSRLISRSTGSQNTRSGVVEATMQAMTASSRQASRAVSYVPHLVSLGGNKIYGQSTVSIAPLTAQSEGSYPQGGYGISTTALGVMTTAGQGLTGEIGGAAVSIGKPTTSSSGVQAIRAGSGTSTTAPNGDITVTYTNGNIVTTVVIHTDGTVTTTVVNTSTSAVLNSSTSSSVTTQVVGSTTVITAYNTDGTRTVVTIGPTSSYVVYEIQFNPAYSRSTMMKMLSYSSAFEGHTNATVWSFFGVSGKLSVGHELYVVMNSDMTVSTVFAVQSLLDAELMASLGVTVSMATTELLEAIMQSTLLVDARVPITTESSEVWVVNTDTDASTRYEGFEFNSYGKLNGKYFGCKEDGVYLLEGDTDDGEPIRASINMGIHDFDTSLNKWLNSAYIGVSASGDMYLKVTVKGGSYVYKSRRTDTDLDIQRFDTGKGLRANYFQFELYNGDGADFELASVEFLAVALKRRI